MHTDSPGGRAGRGEAGGDCVLDLQRIEKRYGSVAAIKPLDLRVVRGECLTILGPSGCGKTTLLRLIAGFIVPSAGRIVLDGIDVAHIPPAQRGIGMVFQHFALFPHMTVAMNVGYGLRMRRWPRLEADKRIAAMLDLVGLSGLGGRLPRELSGGQQQRVALARALAFGPHMLLMDEPLGSLDRDLRFRMAAEIRRIHRELKTTVLYVTHDRDEALAMADRIALMNGGVIQALDRPKELFTQPRSAFVARFFGGYNLLPVSVLAAAADGVRVACLGAELDVRAGTPLRCGEPAWLAVPAAAVHVRPVGPHPLAWQARVAASSFLGDVVRVSCTLPGDVQLLADIPADEVDRLEVGEQVRIYVDRRKTVAVADDAAPPNI